jgi:CheY-like chemotaxis protein
VRQADLREAILRVLGLSSHEGPHPKLITRHSLDEARKHLRILLADDNSINRELTVRILAKRGHAVRMATNGKLAVEAVERQVFDLILMDVQMPEMDGFEATAAIRAKEKLSGMHIPIIAMTAHAMKGDRERCIAAGMDNYIAKPIRAEDLIQMVEGFSGQEGPLDMTGFQKQPVLDWKLALSRVDGDENLLMDLARLFCDECERMIASVREASERKDSTGLERAAHSLKGSVAAFGALGAFDAALKVERLGRSGEAIGMDELVGTLEAEVNQLKAALEDLVIQFGPATQAAGVSRQS